MISIATSGKFWPQPGGDLVCPGGGSGSYSSFLEEKKKPVVIIDNVWEEKAEKITVRVTGVSYD